jgi:hypothetical protein
MVNPLVKKLGAKETAKVSRAIFRDLLNNLSDTRAVYKVGGDYSLKSNYARNVNNPFIIKYPDTPAGQSFQKSFDVYKSLEPLVSSSSKSPTDTVSKIITSGKFNGKKISSAQRRELANRLAVVRMIENNTPIINSNFDKYFSNITKDNIPLSELRESQAFPNTYELFTGPQIKNEKLASLTWPIAAKYSLLEKKIPGFGNIIDTAYAKTPINSPLENVYNGRFYHLIRKLDKAGGWNIANTLPAKRDIAIANNLINKYNITDKGVADTIHTMVSEWDDTPESLVAMAHLINDVPMNPMLKTGISAI